MKWSVFLPVLLPALLACSAVGFQPAECESLSRDSQGHLNEQLYRDLMRGSYSAEDCFEFGGEVVQSIEGGYRIDTYPGDVFVRWEGDYRFVEGDRVVVTAATAEPLTFETVLGVERTIPAFYGSEIVDMQQRRQEAAATRQIIAATAEVEYRANYEQQIGEVFQEIQSSCPDTTNIPVRIQNSYNGIMSELTIDFSVGPAPDNFTANTTPNILLEGYYTIAPYYRGDETKYGKVTARWTGEDCKFEDIQLNEGIRPTRDPSAPRPTYTPRPIP